jgi:hypothetical protein
LAVGNDASAKLIGYGVGGRNGSLIVATNDVDSRRCGWPAETVVSGRQMCIPRRNSGHPSLRKACAKILEVLGFKLALRSVRLSKQAMPTTEYIWKLLPLPEGPRNGDPR